MWIKFYNFNFGETSNGYIPTHESFKSCQFSTFLNSVWKISIVWKLLDLGVKGFCVGMKIKGGESLAGQMESLRRQHPNFTNLPKLVWNSPPFNLFSQINHRRPNSVQLYFYFDSKWMAPIEPIAKPLDFYKTALRQTLVLKHFPFSRSIARKSHIIDYISVQIYQNIFVLGLHHSWT